MQSLPDNLPLRAKILDLGCGDGLVTGLLREKMPQASIAGLDYAEKLLAIFHQKFPDVTIVKGDFNKPQNFFSYPTGESVRLPAASFDVVVSAGALSEYGDLAQALPFVHDLLRDGGLLINIGVQNNVWGRLTGKVWYFEPVGQEEFTAACRFAGFSSVEVVATTTAAFPKNLSDFIIRATK